MFLLARRTLTLLKNIRNTLPLCLNPHKTVLLHLPNELLLQIISELLEQHSIFSLLLTNRRFYTLVIPILNDKFSTKDKACRTALQYAVFSGNESLVSVLLAKGVDTEYWYCHPMGIDPNTNGLDFRKARPALHLAVTVDPPNVLTILKLLLEGGACIDALDANRHSALWEAIEFDKPVAGRFLLENGANYRAGDTYERDGAALHHAARLGSDVMVRLLLEYGADVNAVDNCNRTPLMLAVWATFVAGKFLSYPGGRKTALLEVLLDNGADVSCVDSRNRTPLHHAAHLGDVDVIRLLLERGARTDSLCAEGKSPLDEASTSVTGNQDAVELLMMMT